MPRSHFGTWLEQGRPTSGQAAAGLGGTLPADCSEQFRSPLLGPDKNFWWVFFLGTLLSVIGCVYPRQKGKVPPAGLVTHNPSLHLLLGFWGSMHTRRRAFQATRSRAQTAVGHVHVHALTTTPPVGPIWWDFPRGPEPQGRRCVGAQSSWEWPLWTTQWLEKQGPTWALAEGWTQENWAGLCHPTRRHMTLKTAGPLGSSRGGLDIDTWPRLA